MTKRSRGLKKYCPGSKLRINTRLSRRFKNPVKSCLSLEVIALKRNFLLNNSGREFSFFLGMWHVVMNMTTTMAVTQNFCSVSNFHIVWPKTVRGRPKLSRKWIRILAKKRPEIWKMAQEIDVNAPTGYERFLILACYLLSAVIFNFRDQLWLEISVVHLCFCALQNDFFENF